MPDNERQHRQHELLTAPYDKTMEPNVTGEIPKAECNLTSLATSSSQLQDVCHSIMIDRNDIVNDLQKQAENLRKQLREQSKMIKHFEARHQEILSREEALGEIEEDNRQLTRFQEIVIDELGPYAQQHGFMTEDGVIYPRQALQSLLVAASEVEYLVAVAKSSQEHACALEGDNATLCAQVADLQQKLLARVDKVLAISDEHFAQEFRHLASSVRTMSRSVKFPDGVDVSQSLTRIAFTGHAIPKLWPNRAAKKHYLEAWIWGMLIQIVFQNPFTAFPLHEQKLNGTWRDIFGSGHDQGWPSPSTECEEWRLITVKQLSASSKITNEQSQIAHLGPPNRVSSSCSSIETEATNVSRHLSERGFRFEEQQLRSLIGKAVHLATEMIHQRCRLQVTYPEIGKHFDKKVMSLIADDDGDDVAERLVTFVISPGLTKWGDAEGNNLQHRLDIVPSLVQIGPAETKSESVHRKT